MKRMRDALSTVLALVPAPQAFTVGEHAKIRATGGTSDLDYTVRQTAYDLCKRRGTGC